ncbi:MAG: TRAP transporter large permease subunit, partial [Spirochaetales bacterium]|nr:TRAP transporter large permease subunit [Spirochaetales bacterium]
FFVYRELKLKDIPKIVSSAIYGTVIIMFIVAAAKVFGYVITSAEIPHRLGLFMTTIAPNRYVFVILVNVILLLLGTLVNPSAAVVILTPILLPVAVSFGIDPVFFGVLMICNLAIGNITPPVGLALFVVSAVTKLSIDKIARAIYPYIIILVVQVFIFALVPDIIMFLPNLFGR